MTRELTDTVSVEELAAGCTSTAAFISIHNMVAWLIDRFGDTDQRNQHLPTLISMDRFWNFPTNCGTKVWTCMC